MTFVEKVLAGLKDKPRPEGSYEGPDWVELGQDLKIVKHRGIKMVAAAIPYYVGPITLSNGDVIPDNPVYMSSGAWMDIKTGEVTYE